MMASVDFGNIPFWYIYIPSMKFKALAIETANSFVVYLSLK
mgnify:CR=1 FL=1